MQKFIIFITSPPYFTVVYKLIYMQYREISDNVDESLKIYGLQKFKFSCHYHNLLKMLDFKWIS